MRKRKNASARVGKRRNVSSPLNASASGWNENSGNVKSARRENVWSERRPRRPRRRAEAVGSEACEARARRCGEFGGPREQVRSPARYQSRSKRSC